ncbi:TonB-dependent receptor [Sphingomicrobium aestuariivivum]|uniref:TonB-dependent receptor n=1 Tax=Sphingomicrobium aestuariivivum TaxID=1582356 RepID=UPI001FD66CF2|nr:TonB-dependent receptor [Sphingomicrobium aestuariivivum]MCJ8189815.1 TonB-dependent receptor [Sphingomicrobium aestuariivivum]
MLFQDLPPPPPSEDDVELVDVLLDTSAPDEAILVTAARTPRLRDRASDAVTVIAADRIDRAEPARLLTLLRRVPAAALAEAGPAGSQAQLRLRGAEANHTVLFIDGIKANDPAAANEPRFELLSTSLADSIEALRGPQSALWGPEAIGGVVALRSDRPASRPSDLRLSGETGRFGFARLSGDVATGDDDASLRLALGAQGAEGFDALGGDGDKDGYDLFTGRLAARLALAPATRLETAAFGILGTSEYDGLDPVTFTRADTADETRNRLGAVRLGLVHAPGDWNFRAGGSLLASSNRNDLGDAERNRTAAERLSFDAQATRHFGSGPLVHEFTLALEQESERFRADDREYGGATRQSVSRDRTGLVAEWRTDHELFSLDAALRHDLFDGFADTTSLSAGALVRLADHWSVRANYGEGIAQPNFYELFGFFPENFLGNPDLAPERSRGGDVGLGYDDGRYSAALTLFGQGLEDEIVNVFDPVTFVTSAANRDGKSRRRGIEAEFGARLSQALQLGASYAYVDAGERLAPDGLLLRETRRPEHQAALWLDGTSRGWTYAASLAWVGAREDLDFDLFPAPRVLLGDYVLADARLAREIGSGITVSVRGENLFDSDYRDVIGYATAGRSLFVGLALAR